VSTVGHHIATVRQYDPATGIAKVVVPALYGDIPIDARPFLTAPDDLALLTPVAPGDTVVAFYDDGDPMTILRWYLPGGLTDLTGLDARIDALEAFQAATGGFTTATPTLPAGWEIYAGGYAPPMVIKFGLIVVSQGLVKRSVGAATFTSGTVATIPAGFRPTSGNHIFNQMASTTTAASPVRLDINTVGVVTLAASPAISLTPGNWISLMMVWTTV